MAGKTNCLVLEACLVYSTTPRKGPFVSRVVECYIHGFPSKAGRSAERCDVRLIRNSFVNKDRRGGREYTTQHFNAGLRSLSLATGLGDVRRESRRYVCNFIRGGLPGSAPCSQRYSGDRRYMKQGQVLVRLPGGSPAGILQACEHDTKGAGPP